MPASADRAGLVDRLRAFTERGPQGATLRLATATDFAWDQVHAFAASAPLSFMRDRVGVKLDLDDEVEGLLGAHSALLIFTHEGAVVRQVVIAPPLFLVGARGTGFTPDTAVLTVHTRDPGPYTALRFADPPTP